MTVSIKFDSSQNYQLEAIDSVTSLFEGWTDFEWQPETDGLLPDELVSSQFFANRMGVSEEQLDANIRKVQARERFNSEVLLVPVVPETLRMPPGEIRNVRDFSIEMETGTGKTYVYLRTAIELYVKYNLSKFVVIVPTVAIREGVLSALSSMKQHFHELYPGVQYDSYVYDSKNMGRLRQFGTTKHLQIMVMNIQAFSKDTNLINREDENLQDLKPVEFITATNPVLILDEPQKLDGKTQKQSIENLNPLFKLRYSATHKENHCLVYRLGPVDAYEQKLVKRIEVLSITAEENMNIAYVEVRKINVSKESKPSATVLVNRLDGRKQLTIKKNQSLFDLTEMSIYKGWEVEDIVVGVDANPGYVEFSNGRRIAVNSTNDVESDWWQRAQISATIEKHFETELRLQQAAEKGEIKPMKPLTLFFIDRVANFYPSDGKFKIWFDELYESIASSHRKYRNLDLPKAVDARDGYFSVTKDKSSAKDTNGDTKEDSESYDRILKNKERLISPEEPVRFVFSHSALSEGWDNPNVFTICNLQETQSEIKRRQQIGRGLRLPVMENGERCRVDRLNALTIVASETFQNYATALQKEMTADTGERFGAGQIVDARKRREVKLKNGFESLSGFKELWALIAPRTIYELAFSTQDLIDEAAIRLKDMGKSDPISAPKILIKQTSLVMSAGKDIQPGRSQPEIRMSYKRDTKMPDILVDLQSTLPISRSTITKVINESGRLSEMLINPAAFAFQVRKAIRQSLASTLVDRGGIKYYPVEGQNSHYFASFFSDGVIESYDDNIVDVKKSIFDAVVCDSNIEKNFALALDSRDDVELFIKLPDWYKIPTPIGSYNPDWAVVRKDQSGARRLYLVVETKGSVVLENLQFEGERWKINFGKHHFLAIKVDYKVASTIEDLYTTSV
jgi:type III restriction enzyme